GGRDWGLGCSARVRPALAPERERSEPALQPLPRDARIAAMRIAVLGSGGVGGYFGGRLAAAGADVTFLARGAHLEALRTRGLRIDSPKGGVHIANAKAAGDPAAVGPRHTAGGTCYVSAVIAEPGVIRHTAMDHLIFGEVDGRRTPRMEALLEACRPAGFQSTLSGDITADIWSKFVRLSVLSGLTTAARSPLGVIIGDADLFAMLKDALREAMAVARAKGISVPASTVEDVAAAYRALPPQTKSSMLEDLERGRPLELP